MDEKFSYYRPERRFYLWLDLTDDKGANRWLSAKGAVRAILGACLERLGQGGTNPGNGHVRITLVQEAGEVEDALTRLVLILRQRTLEKRTSAATDWSAKTKRVVEG